MRSWAELKDEKENKKLKDNKLINLLIH